jgi:hypothetical protein
MVFVAGPNEIADRILHLHSLLGRSRQILQMDVGGMPRRDVLRAASNCSPPWGRPRSAPHWQHHEPAPSPLP